jgi:transcriptional regulator with GAF, ATPase, and Fis domain
MKTFYNVFSIVLVLLYIAGVLFGVYYLTYDAAKIQKVASIFPELVYLVIALSVVGLLGFMFLFLRRETDMEIVYTTSQGITQVENVLQSIDANNTDSNEQTVIAKNLFFKAKQESNNNPKVLLEVALRNICQYIEVGIGAVYVRQESSMELQAAYALYRAEGEVIRYQVGEGLVGQVAKDGKPIKLSQVPEGYMEVVSGLGSAYPHYLLLFPVKNIRQEVNAVIELATFKNVGAQELAFLEEMALLLAKEIEGLVVC